MKTFPACVTQHLDVPPDDLFALFTDIGRLPQWNAHIDHVVETPPALAPGREWVVEIRAMGTKWDSRSELQVLDLVGRRFAHLSRSDDGNPSRAQWTWDVEPDGEGSRVTVAWELRPRTFWRRVLFARIRHRQLKHEVRTSLGAAVGLLHDPGRLPAAVPGEE